MVIENGNSQNLLFWSKTYLLGNKIMSRKKFERGSHLETLDAPKCDPKTRFFFGFICQSQKWLLLSILLMKATRYNAKAIS